MNIVSEVKQKPKVVVVIPTKNEQAAIENCIESTRQSSYRPEVIVSDGHSNDRTREIALKNQVIVVMPEKRLHPGRGATMKTGLETALKKEVDIIVFLDADNINQSSDRVDKLVDAVSKEGYDIARGQYLCAPGDAPVTKLVAKPLLWTFFPEVAHYEQPLSGEIAAKNRVWKDFLKRDPPDGWGIDIWLLIEAAMSGYKIKEVFLGMRKPLSLNAYQDDIAILGKMSEQVALVIIQEALKYERIDNGLEIGV